MLPANEVIKNKKEDSKPALCICLPDQVYIRGYFVYEIRVRLVMSQDSNQH
jgi:hypothetical protein